jgi:GH25 family lysozyme M1 (1,4-beta-N-acetylmuramidase)
LCGDCAFSYESDYVWYSEIFSGAEGDGEGALAYGIDLSFWNENVDFERLKKEGLDFVIIRAGSINQVPDYQFESHYKKAKEAGLDVGCYFYSYAETVAEVEEEVEILLEIIKGKKFEYPIYFDMEEQFQTELSTERRMEMCYAFCELMIENGYFPGVYANLKWLTNYFNSEELCTYFDVWYARYPIDADNGSKPIYFEDWDYELPEAASYGIWQFTQSGRIDGVSGNVDLNVAYKDYPALIKKYGYNGY